MNLECNLFFIHTPFQVMTVISMINNMEHLQQSDNYLVLDMEIKSTKLKDLIEVNDVFIISKPIGKYRIKGGKKILQDAEEMLIEYKKIYKQINIFLSDIWWPINNIIYGITKFKQEGITLNNFPDGLANLMRNNYNYKVQTKYIIKKVLSYIGGYPVYNCHGNQIGYDIYDNIYTYTPHLINTNNTNIRKIPVRKSLIKEQDTNKLVFLGQNYDATMKLKHYEKLCQESCNLITKLGYKDLYYKPHHFEETTIAREIFRANGFNILEDSTPIELLCFERMPACVVSYNSSALLHLKLLFNNSIRCVSVLIDKVYTRTYKKADIEYTKKLFNKFDIEVL